MKTKLAILSHESAQPTVDEFLPYWEAVTDDVEIFVPDGHKGGTAIGPDGYRGDAVLGRFVDVCKTLLHNRPADDLYVIAEYDVLPLQPVLPRDILHHCINCGSVILRDKDGNADPRKLCALPPWIVTRPMLAALLTACEAVPTWPEPPEWTLGGLLDRLIGEAIRRAGLLSNNLRDILPHVDNQPDPHKHIAATGKTWIHGWKKLEDFKPLI